MTEAKHTEPSLVLQCELMGISRSSWYYEAKGQSELKLRLMHLINEQFLRTP